MTRQFDSLDEFTAMIGQPLGTSGWRSITQEQIDGFAEATGDRHWLHVDPVRAALGPFGTTIAHGFFTLSLLAVFAEDIYRIGGTGTMIHTGIDAVRFWAPVPVSSRLRASATLTVVEPLHRTTRVTVSFAVEREGSARPVLTADALFLASPPSPESERLGA